MAPEKSQGGAQLLGNEQEREEAQCETLLTQLIRNELGIIGQLICYHHMHGSGDIRAVGERETTSSGEKQKNKNKREKAVQNKKKNKQKRKGK